MRALTDCTLINDYQHLCFANLTQQIEPSESPLLTGPLPVLQVRVESGVVVCLLFTIEICLAVEDKAVIFLCWCHK